MKPTCSHICDDNCNDINFIDVSYNHYKYLNMIFVYCSSHTHDTCTILYIIVIIAFSN